MDKAMSREQALKWIEAACNGDSTTRHAFSTIRRELVTLRMIAQRCKEEIDHGFDLPSEVFELTEAFYNTFVSKQDACANCGCVRSGHYPIGCAGAGGSCGCTAFKHEDTDAKA